MTDRDLTLRRGYPPSAHRVIAIDYDGTIVAFGYLDEEPPLKDGAVAGIARLRARGYRIVVFTSRLASTWLEESGYTEHEMRQQIERTLRRHHIPFDEITGEKPPAAHYVDDRAIRFADNWREIVDFILWKDSEVD